MKIVLLIVILFLLSISCSENPTSPINENNVYNLSEEAANFPWELFSGKIVIDRYNWGLIFIDCDAREMSGLRKIPYLDLITWHHSGTKITGADRGGSAIWGGESRFPKYYCIDLEGNNSSTQYSSYFYHSWSNDGRLASLQARSIFINEQLSILTIQVCGISRPAWSTDSKYLVVSLSGSDMEGTYSEIKKYDINTGDGVTLIVADSVGYRYSFLDPIYSPDGNKIAYVKRTLSPYPENRATKEIWLMNSDGSNNQRLTNNYIDSFPAWSPDGTKIIFQRNVEDARPENSEGIFLINIDGTGLRKVLSDGSMLPIWR